METEVTNTLLGILTLPAWLEAILAITSVSFLLWMSWIKSKRQTEALEALEDACKALCAVSRETIIEQRNLYGMIQNRLESDSTLNANSADIFVSGAINSVFYQVMSFCIEIKGEKPENLVQDFCGDCFIEFASSLSRVQKSNGKCLGDFAQITRWHFEERLPNKILVNQDPLIASQYIKQVLEKEWARWK
jgi:hypothetical protein